MGYRGKFIHTIGRIQHIAIMIRIDIYCTDFRLGTQTVAPNLPGFQGLKRCIQYLDIHHHKPILYPYHHYVGLNFIMLTWNLNQVEDYTTQHFTEYHQE